MTNFYVTYTLADPETREAYIKEVLASGVIEKSRAEDGCIRYEYFYPVGSDTTLFLWEQWESREHQKVHCQTEHFAVLTGIKEKFGAVTESLSEDQVIQE